MSTVPENLHPCPPGLFSDDAPEGSKKQRKSPLLRAGEDFFLISWDKYVQGQGLTSLSASVGSDTTVGALPPTDSGVGSNIASCGASLTTATVVFLDLAGVTLRILFLFDVLVGIMVIFRLIIRFAHLHLLSR